MASIIPGYNYDIFISYRQKDNKYDGWVTEFVDNLRRELEATFKDEISVYFDINPHDGLLETHDVDASLKEKLKCLVFIPVLSRTYCDPKSFAWEHEFKAFIEEASSDRFGLKVKLQNGNIASRVLPVRIHDLDKEDINLCESLLGGVLRGVEFIYKSAGVNRPLRAIEEKSQENLNKTIYRDQINKVSLAIKEIILGLKAGSDTQVKKNIQLTDIPGENKHLTKKVSPAHHRDTIIKKWISTVAVAAVLIIAAVYGYQKLFKRNEHVPPDDRIPVAVMPFQNMTNDTTWNIWQDGIQTNLINFLTNSEELKVKQKQIIDIILEGSNVTNYASLTQSFASSISRKLGAKVFICGSIIQAGTTIRVNAQLIDTKTEEAIKTYQIDGPDSTIFKIIDSLSVMVRNSLIISKMSEMAYGTYATEHLRSVNSPDAYRYFIYGQIAWDKMQIQSAIDWYLKALSVDSNLIEVYPALIITYFNIPNIKEARAWYLKYTKKLDKMDKGQKQHVEWFTALLYGTPKECIKYLQQMKEMDDQDAMAYFNTGDQYLMLKEYDKAIPEFEKAIEIFDKYGIKYKWIPFYSELGMAYHKTGQYRKEEKLYNRIVKENPEGRKEIFDQQAYLYFSLGDTVRGNQYLNKWIEFKRGQSMSEVEIAVYIASYIYDFAGMADKSEEYFRKALSLEPENFLLMNQLAYFLIDKDRNINEGLELVEKVLEKNPEAMNAMHIKGWALYKQGKYKEALDLLQKSWDLRRKIGLYNHEAFLHLEAAKKAAEGKSDQ
jgi:tetratricopeptide (TPR) repeat protein/TolB-like protein